MQEINSSSEYWSMPDDWHEQVARAARLCYASKGKRPAAEFCEMLWKSGHRSMFRHGTKYFVIPSVSSSRQVSNTSRQFTEWMEATLRATPYVGITSDNEGHRFGDPTTFFISTNMQYIRENEEIAMFLKTYEVSQQTFVDYAYQYGCLYALNLLRYTFCLTTQISTSRELNRTSPNAISEQSTRYVNFGKRGGITIARPHWFYTHGPLLRIFSRIVFRFNEWSYMMALKYFHLPPQDAREFLPLTSGTRVAYTYSYDEWKHILDLRYYGKTGKPHPNAQLVSGFVFDELTAIRKQLLDNKKIV